MTPPNAHPAPLQRNWSLLSAAEQSTAEMLLSIGQHHVFDAWPSPGDNDEGKRRLLAQALALDQQYPGGLKAYIGNAKKLLQQSKDGINPFSGFTPSVPQGSRLAPGTAEFADAEALGANALHRTAFVLVAGGLGERLGYNGIKISLPAELTTNRSFMQCYIDFILAYQTRARQSSSDAKLTLPLAIMTSDDTHQRTLDFLAQHNNFGMKDGQITIVKQEKVPALQDNDARFAVCEDDAFSIVTKPHGHGDVHTLLHQSNTVQKWVNDGFEWIVFFQDTNSLVFRALPAALGVSVQNEFEVNTITVPRRPGEAVGGICKLTKGDQSLTINVEYNQLDPLLRATSSPAGDVADAASGFSPYPGNTNALVFAARPYLDVLNRTDGSMPEFVNPKYADDTKTRFKKPTRLECMMQDYPRLLSASAKVGFTQLQRWMAFSPVKNNVVDALAKYKATGFAESAASGEASVYEADRRILQMACNSAKFEEAPDVEFAGIPMANGARVVLMPSVGVTFAEIASKFRGADLEMTAASTLVVDGDGVRVSGKVELDGALVLRCTKPHDSMQVRDLVVQNRGWPLCPLQSQHQQQQHLAIRGFYVDRRQHCEVVDGETSHIDDDQQKQE